MAGVMTVVKQSCDVDHMGFEAIKNPARGGAESKTTVEYCLDHSHLFNITDSNKQHYLVT